MSDDGQESATSTNADVMGEVLQGRMFEDPQSASGQLRADICMLHTTVFELISLSPSDWLSGTTFARQRFT
jgi:hypothetical protein